MKRVQATAPWLVPDVLKLLEESGLHPSACADVGHPTVDISVPDAEVPLATALLAEHAARRVRPDPAARRLAHQLSGGRVMIALLVVAVVTVLVEVSPLANGTARLTVAGVAGVVALSMLKLRNVS